MGRRAALLPVIDDNYRISAGPLRQFLTVFGFAMDNTREFVEGLLELHQIDKTPMSLLKGLGSNYGLPYESGIGDIRYRGLVANAPRAQHTRGTAVGLAAGDRGRFQVPDRDQRQPDDDAVSR